MIFFKFDILKFKHDSEALWSFFCTWFGFLYKYSNLFRELRDNVVLKNFCS